jgi:hypothetical protein
MIGQTVARIQFMQSMARVLVAAWVTARSLLARVIGKASRFNDWAAQDRFRESRRNDQGAPHHVGELRTQSGETGRNNEKETYAVSDSF